MRTVKKSLCLVLALIFVLGLCTIGSNAGFAKYTDMDKVNYEEAVEVLTGLGVIEGYPDGSFEPTASVTRAEAAAMIARMMLGREKADKLPIGEVKFTDVPETNWAAKYIAFCANKGIIVGMGDGTFHPSENVTGTQMATMLLRALGYGVMASTRARAGTSTLLPTLSTTRSSRTARLRTSTMPPPVRRPLCTSGTPCGSSWSATTST